MTSLEIYLAALSICALLISIYVGVEATASHNSLWKISSQNSHTIGLLTQLSELRTKNDETRDRTIKALLERIEQLERTR